MFNRSISVITICVLAAADFAMGQGRSETPSSHGDVRLTMKFDSVEYREGEADLCSAVVNLILRFENVSRSPVFFPKEIDGVTRIWVSKTEEDARLGRYTQSSSLSLYTMELDEDSAVNLERLDPSKSLELEESVNLFVPIRDTRAKPIPGSLEPGSYLLRVQVRVRGTTTLTSDWVKFTLERPDLCEERT